MKRLAEFDRHELPHLLERVVEDVGGRWWSAFRGGFEQLAAHAGGQVTMDSAPSLTNCAISSRPTSARSAAGAFLNCMMPREN